MLALLPGQVGLFCAGSTSKTGRFFFVLALFPGQVGLFYWKYAPIDKKERVVDPK